MGCGKVGARLGERLVRAGGQVLALRRDPTALPEAFTPLAVDLRKPVDKPLPEVDALVITLPPGQPAGPGQEDDYLVALKNLAAALPSIPRRVVLVSSTRVFEGRPGPTSLTEDDAPAPVSARGRTLRAGELLAADLFGAHILRPAGIYGPGREMLVRKVLEGAPVDYSRRTNRIHETDLVRALHALLLAQDSPAILHAVDQAPVPLGEVVTCIAHLLHMPAPPETHPETAGGTVLDGARLLRFLGTLNYPTFRTGYEEIIAARADHS